MSLICSQAEIYGLVCKGLIITVLVLVPVLNAPEIASINIRFKIC